MKYSNFTNILSDASNGIKIFDEFSRFSDSIYYYSPYMHRYIHKHIHENISKEKF